MSDALDLAPIRDFRDLALAQYVSQMTERDRNNGEVPDVIVYFDLLMDEIERLRGDLAVAENLAELPRK